MVNHDWSEADDITALYVYRFGTERLGTTRIELARSRGIKPRSFHARVKNFQALDGKGGLDHWAYQSEQVFHRYGKSDEATLRHLVTRVGVTAL